MKNIAAGIAIIYAPTKRDATDYNWQRKRAIYGECRLYLSTPCGWLMRKVEQSILAPAVKEARIIPYGVDLSAFHPEDKESVRRKLEMPSQARVLLFAAKHGRQNICKDFRTLREAVAKVSECTAIGDLLFLALGDDAPAERIGNANVRLSPSDGSPGGRKGPIRLPTFTSMRRELIHFLMSSSKPCHAAHRWSQRRSVESRNKLWMGKPAF